MSIPILITVLLAIVVGLFVLARKARKKDRARRFQAESERKTSLVSDGADEGEAPGNGGGNSDEKIAALLEVAWGRDAVGDLESALEAFGKAIERGPNAGAYYGRGVVRCKLRDYPAAIADLCRAIEMRPRFPAAFTERGLAHVESGDVEKGIQDYDTAIAIDPSYGVAHENKGAACLMLERWAEAVPHLDIALRLSPSQAIARYHRGIAHEMLGDLSRAIRDFQDSVQSDPRGPMAPHAEGRLHALQAHAGDVPEPAFPAPESLWTLVADLSFEDTVADLVRKAHAGGAFFGRFTLPNGGKTFTSFYGRQGLRKLLTEIADVIGPRILTLKLGQFDGLFSEPPEKPSAPAVPARGETEAKRWVEGQTIHVLVNGDRFLGVFADGFEYHYPDLPTALFGEQPIFGRSESADTKRRCSSCGRDVAYFDAVIDENRLVDYACPHCTASPTDAWL